MLADCAVAPFEEPYTANPTSAVLLLHLVARSIYVLEVWGLYMPLLESVAVPLEEQGVTCLPFVLQSHLEACRLRAKLADCTVAPSEEPYTANPTFAALMVRLEVRGLYMPLLESHAAAPLGEQGVTASPPSCLRRRAVRGAGGLFYLRRAADAPVRRSY